MKSFSEAKGFSQMKHTASLTPMQPPACSATMGQLEGFLRSSVSSLPEEASCGARGPGRPCELSARCLWAAFLVCLLRGLRSQKAVWRRLRLGPLWSFSHSQLTASAIYKRLDEAGTGPIERLFEQISGVLMGLVGGLIEQGEQEGTISRLAPFAPDILALDETVLDQVARRLPILRGVAVLLPGKLVSLFSVRFQQWRRIHVRSGLCAEREGACAPHAHGAGQRHALALRPGLLLFQVV